MAKIPGLNPLQKAVYTALSESITTVPVLDYAEENQLFPYITIGEDNLTDGSSKTDYSDVADCTVSVWSRAKGFSEVKSLMSEIVSVLSELKTELDGYSIRFYSVIQMETSRESDGITRSGMVRVRFRVNQD